MGCECDDKLARFISPLVVFAQFCIVMWGTILVFGWYSSWTYDVNNNTKDEYCGYTPYMYSFVMLILGWCTLPFLLFCSCQLCFVQNEKIAEKMRFIHCLPKPNSNPTSHHHKISDINHAFKSLKNQIREANEYTQISFVKNVFSM